MTLQNKVAMVTGAAAGIGRATATAMASEGASDSASYCTGSTFSVDGGMNPESSSL